MNDIVLCLDWWQEKTKCKPVRYKYNHSQLHSAHQKTILWLQVFSVYKRLNTPFQTCGYRGKPSIFRIPCTKAWSLLSQVSHCSQSSCATFWAAETDSLYLVFFRMLKDLLASLFLLVSLLLAFHDKWSFKNVKLVSFLPDFNLFIVQSKKL